MTKPKKYQYRIQYIDNTFQVVDWTKNEFKQIGEDMKEGNSVSLMEDGLFRLSDIRTIVFLPEIPEQEKNEDGTDKEEHLTEWGFVDQATAEWLKAQGIDLSKGVNN